MRAHRFGLFVVAFYLVPTALHAQCLGDGDNSGSVTVDEIVTAVNNALNGCPQGPPATVTNTEPSGLTPTPTSSRTPSRSATPSLTPTTTNSPTRTPTASNTVMASITMTPTITPTRSITATLSPSPSLTPTPNLVAIDFGPAGGKVGQQTVLPFIAFPGIVAASLDLVVDFDSSNFNFLSCQGSGLSITPTDLFGSVRLQITVVPQPRELGPGTFMECSFSIGDADGFFPVTLTGTITDADGNDTPVSADGFFTIDPECREDDDCLPTQSCVFDQCVTRTPTFTRTGTPTPTLTPSTTPTPSRSTTSTPSATATRTPTRTATATPTRTSTPTSSPTHTPTVTRTDTRTPTLTPTLTQNPMAIDFGPAGGQVGSTTSLPFELTDSIVVSSMDLTVQYDSSAFSFNFCSGFDLDISTQDFGGVLEIDVNVTPPRLLFQGEFMRCSFDVIGSSGFYPVSMSGTITDGDGVEFPIVADGQFTIFPECNNRFDCDFDESCVNERCVDNTPTPTISPTSPPTTTRTPTRTPTLTLTPTPTLSPTVTPTATHGPGPSIRYLGILTASNQLVESIGTAADGAPIFAPPTGLGFGFFIVIEAEMGTSGALPGSLLFSASGRPDVQIQANRNLGSGSLQVCDVNGIPGIEPPSFDPGSAMITNALNDFSCRFEIKSQFQPCQGGGGFIDGASDAQVCTQGTVTTAFQFPSGDTRLTARWRDQLGNLGPPASVIVRIS